MRTGDVLVIGLGVFGAAAAQALAERGARVLAVDAHGPTHRFGSSHGETRIFRRAYWEGTDYLPLLERAHERWTDLEAAYGDTLLMRTGGVFVGAESSGVVDLSRQTAETGGIAHEVWNAEQLNGRFPWFGVGADMKALYEPGAYTVLANRARLAMIDEAVRRGASIRFGEEVVDLRSAASGVTVRLRSGGTLSCDAVVVATGPWMKGPLAPSTARHLSPMRVPVYWFRADPKLGTEGFPAFLYESADGQVVYGVPEWGEGGREVKIGFHNRQQTPGDPTDLARREVSAQEREEMARMVARIFTGVQPEAPRARYCYYTLTPDGSFIIDRSPADPRIVHTSACSGHGFKFAPAVGECAAALALGEPAPVDLAPFAGDRFGAGAAGDR
ncbi:N-methyl-L-tryptophan oxidase [Kitasatospora sp. NPDC059146]|uniref:N-methyl-L-tryptophan oxidase n=1 Tax=unclassified Kitasatospora TaxID=2633591 RepID=UPI0036A7EB14